MVSIIYCGILYSLEVASLALYDDIELLKQVAMLNKANQEAIMTWKGKVSFISTTIRKKTAIMDIEDNYNINYAYDKKLDKTMFFCMRLYSKGISKGENVDDKKPLYYGGIRCPEGIYTRGPWQEDGQNTDSVRHNTVFNKRDDFQHSDFSISFMPFRYFNLQQMNTNDRLMFFYNGMKNNSIKSLKVTRQNDIVTLHALDSTKSGSRSTVGKYVFDLAKGGNPILVEVTVPGEWKYKSENTFEFINNVWVPSAVQVENISIENESTVSESRVKITWLEQQINMPVNPQLFDIDQIGTQKGDKVIDRRTQVEYRYDENLELPSLPAKGRFWSYFMVAGLIVTALLVILLVRVRLSKRAQETKP